MVSGGFRWIVSGGFRWFQVVSGGWFQVVSGGFRWFQVIPTFSNYQSESSTFFMYIIKGIIHACRSRFCNNFVKITT